MTQNEIAAALDGLAKAMTARGYIGAMAECSITTYLGPDHTTVTLRANVSHHVSAQAVYVAKGEALEDQLVDAAVWIAERTTQRRTAADAHYDRLQKMIHEAYADNAPDDVIGTLVAARDKLAAIKRGQVNA